MILQKIKRVQKIIQREKLNGLILGNFGTNISDDLLYYLILQNPEVATIYIPAKGKPTLYCTPFEVNQRQNECPEILVEPLNKASETEYVKHLKPGSKIGLQLNTLPTTEYFKFKKISGVEFFDFNFKNEVISQKLPTEILALTKACKITDIIFAKLIKNWMKFKTEKDAANFITQEATKHNCETSFSPIIASGKNAANPHHQPEATKIKKGFCVIDMGIRYLGYCSDMTRTIYISKPSQADLSLYNKIMQIQTRAVKMVKAGVIINSIDNFVRTALGEKLNKEFIHGLGHGVGSQVHEWPPVGSRETSQLKENMIITIEPGVYSQEKYGIRIEDDVLVTKSGSKILNKTSKKLVIIA